MAKNSLSAQLAETLKQVSALASATKAAVQAELSKDGRRLGIGSALIGCALVAALGLPPLLILAFVWGLVALGLPPWAAYLIAAGVILLLAAVFGLAGGRLLKLAARSIGKTAAMIKDSLAALQGTVRLAEEEAQLAAAENGQTPAAEPTAAAGERREPNPPGAPGGGK
ncbi:MAG: phage holin family protein [Bifidobacteriaceae bacterium]|jgi:hypothetical protein|nr:phage holin family protein [Bifidobacteriaceae bacterium]